MTDEAEEGPIRRVAKEIWAKVRRSPADSITEFMGETIWQWDLDAMSRTQQALVQILRLAYLVGRGFISARAQQQAMALTYTTMLALVPAFAIMVALFSVRGLEAAKGKVETFVIDALSASDAQANVLAGQLNDLVAHLQGSGGVAGIAFFVFLFFTIIALLSTLEKALNDIWEVKRSRSPINKFVTYWCIATLGPICLGAALVQGSSLQSRVESFASSARQTGSEWLTSDKDAAARQVAAGDEQRFMFAGVGGALADQWEAQSRRAAQKTGVGANAKPPSLDDFLGDYRSAETDSALSRVFSLGMTILTFLCLYIFLPNTRVRWKPALIGALTAALLWAGTRWALASTSATLVRYNTVYGSLATIPITMVWLYLTWLIVILGAELGFAIQNLKTQRKEELAGATTELFQETVALRIVANIAKAFEKGQRPPDLEELHELTGAPVNLCADLLYHLSQDGLLREIELEDGVRGYVAGRPLDKISISDVVDSLRERKGISFELTPGVDLPILQRHLDQANAASKALAGRITLRQVVKSLADGEATDPGVTPETAAVTAAAATAIKRLSQSSLSVSRPEPELPTSVPQSQIPTPDPDADAPTAT